jgi:hypothetical protein
MVFLALTPTASDWVAASFLLSGEEGPEEGWQLRHDGLSTRNCGSSI